MIMELPGLRTWVIFYLISFVVLMWAAFLTASGTMLWVSLMLVIVVIGINFITVYSQLKQQDVAQGAPGRIYQGNREKCRKRRGKNRRDSDRVPVHQSFFV